MKEKNKRPLSALAKPWIPEAFFGNEIEKKSRWFILHGIKR
jgi:hypothetical protein